MCFGLFLEVALKRKTDKHTGNRSMHMQTDKQINKLKGGKEEKKRERKEKKRKDEKIKGGRTTKDNGQSKSV